MPRKTQRSRRGGKARRSRPGRRTRQIEATILLQALTTDPAGAFTFRGKTYRLRRDGIPGDADGYCEDPRQAEEKRVLAIRPDLTPKRELVVSIHEPLHACLWDLDEEAVKETAESLADFLWELGYRRARL